MENVAYQQPAWQCMLCGNYSTDIEERERSWEDHLNFHQITQERYDSFVTKKGGGLDKMRVTLLNWTNNPELAIMSFMNQTWGPTVELKDFSAAEIETMVKMSLDGKTLSQALESISFTFQIEGISRACSHQLVRVRIGGGFSQKGQSDAYYGDIDYVIPASVEAVGKTDDFNALMEKCSSLYNELFELGVPFQDARFVLPQASTTTIVWTTNYLALYNFCAKRLQNFMQWEINTLARMIREEVRKVYPIFADALRPRCEITKTCHSFGNLFSGCGKFPIRKSDTRYIFSAIQNKNIRFDEEGLAQMREINKLAGRGENHWLHIAREEIKNKQLEDE